MTPEELLVEKLIEKNFHISFAESCTGGMCCGTIVNVPNASRVLDMSFVTYADYAKTELLGVAQQSIDDFGVVSEQVAREMARGVASKAGSDIGVGITGIAGPTGATETKPVGMVCFGFCIGDKVKTFTCYFGNIGRNNVREKSVDFVFSTLLNLLK